MDDNNSTVYVQNDVVYNVPSIAVVSSGNEVYNIIQPELQSNAIFINADQLKSLGIQVIEDINIPVQIESPSVVFNPSNTINTQQIDVKLQSILINNQNTTKVIKNEVNIKSSPTVRVFKKIAAKTNVSNISNVKSIKPKEKKKIAYRVIRPDILKVKNAQSADKPVKVNEKVPPVTKVPANDMLFKRIGVVNEKNGSLSHGDSIDEDTVTLKAVRTRFGRITKPPKHFKREKDISGEKKSNQIEPPVKQIRITANEEKINTTQVTPEIQTINNTLIPSLLNEDAILESTDLISSELLVNSAPIHRKRKIASTKFRCKTCHRFYLGRAKMKKHLQLNPDHRVPNKYESDNQLWLDLLERTYSAPKTEQVSTFIGELSHILEKVQNLVPKGLKPVSNKDEPNSFQIDNMLSRLLGVSEGKYILDIDVLNTSNVISPTEKLSTENSIFTHLNSLPLDLLDSEKILNDTENAVQTSLLNLLDTGQVHFDTSESSEAVRCVDQLVNERLKTLTGVESVVDFAIGGLQAERIFGAP